MSDNCRDSERYGPDTRGSERHEGYGLNYTGFGFRCPECGHIGTYLDCTYCGYEMDGPDSPRYRGPRGDES